MRRGFVADSDFLVPIYEFRCNLCGTGREQFFHTFGARERAAKAGELVCECGGVEELLVSVPSLDIWQPRDLFGVESDGPIESRTEYRRLLKEQNLQEDGAAEKAPKRRFSTAAAEVAQQAFEQGLVGKTDRLGDNLPTHRVAVTRESVEAPE